jgi:hypothetical protein
VATGSAFSNVLKAKEDLQKSPEQLEQEKRSVLSQRVPQLQLDGKTKEDLIEKVLRQIYLFYQLFIFSSKRQNNFIIFFNNYMVLFMN